MKCYNCNSTIPEVSDICPYCKKEVDTNAESVVDFGDISDTDFDKKIDIKVYVTEPKNRKIVFMTIGLVVLVIIILIVLIMSMFFSKKEPGYQLFTEVSETFFEYLDENFLGSNSTSVGEYELNMTINGQDSSFDGNYAYDIKNKIISLNGVMKDPREASGGVILETLDFEFDAYLKEDEFYFQSNELYDDNHIYIPIEDETGFLATKNYSLDSVVGGIQDAWYYTLKDMDYMNETTKINYRGKETSVKKNYILLDNANKKKFLMNFYTNLIDDTNFINEIARVKGKKIDEITETLKNYRTTVEYKYSGESSNHAILAIYYSGSKIYRLEYDATNDESNDLYQFDIGENKYYFDYFKDDKNKYSATLAVSSKEMNEIVTKTYNITLDSDNYVIDIDLELEIDGKGKVNKPDITNYKNIKDFTEEDYMKIKSNAQLYVSDVSFIDKVRDIFKEKCTPDLNCVCTDDNTCSCTYGSEIITCPKDLVIVEGTQVMQ